MAVLKAFRALRPTPEYASKVAALPYDVMNSDEARRMVFGNPYSFLHVDKAEIDLPKSVDIYDDRVYEKARENLSKLVSAEVMKQDEKPCLYIYEQTWRGRKRQILQERQKVTHGSLAQIPSWYMTRRFWENQRMRKMQSGCLACFRIIVIRYTPVYASGKKKIAAKKSVAFTKKRMWFFIR